MQSSVPLTRGTPAAYAPAAPRVAVRSLRTLGRRKLMNRTQIATLLVITMLVVVFVEGYRLGRADVPEDSDVAKPGVTNRTNSRAQSVRRTETPEPIVGSEEEPPPVVSVENPPPRQDPAPPASIRASGGSSVLIKNPKPFFIGSPGVLPPNAIDPQKLPWGLTLPTDSENVARGKPVTSSDSEPLLGDLALITDGVKECEEGSYVELQSGTQWVQIDLLREVRIDGIGMWHFCLSPRTYKDVQLWVSSDPEFKTGTAVFNNDVDGSLGSGVGTNVVYLETHLGLLQMAGSITGRFLRAYSSGSTANGFNHYIEIEVYGREP